jgi:hypothetical protein
MDECEIFGKGREERSAISKLSQLTPSIEFEICPQTPAIKTSENEGCIQEGSSSRGPRVPLRREESTFDVLIKKMQE